MIHPIKPFLFGVVTAYTVYYITRKGTNGTSILDDLLDNPSLFLNKAKDYAIDDLIRKLNKQISRY